MGWREDLSKFPLSPEMQAKVDALFAETDDWKDEREVTMTEHIEFEFSHLDRFVSLVTLTADLKREMEQGGVDVKSDAQVFRYLARNHLGLLLSNSDKWDECWELDEANRTDDGKGDETSWDLILDDAGFTRIRVVKDVWAITSLSLKESNDLVTQAPSRILSAVPKDQAEEGRMSLVAAGAYARVVPHTEDEPEPEPKEEEAKPEPKPEPDEGDDEEGDEEYYYHESDEEGDDGEGDEGDGEGGMTPEEILKGLRDALLGGDPKTPPKGVGHGEFLN